MTTQDQIPAPDMAPLVTIVTVCYNAAADIEATILQIRPHLSAAVEYLVIDGGSRDETVSIVRRYLSCIRCFVSEPDNGIYDAMNKGVLHSRGDFILFINAGDCLLTIPLAQLKNHSSSDLLCFPVSIDRKFEKVPRLGLMTGITNTLPHQGCFYRRKNFLNYNTAYKVYADYDLNLRMMKAKRRIDVFDDPVIAVHMLDGISNNAKSATEFFSIIRSHFGILAECCSFLYFKARGLAFRIGRQCS